VISSGVIDLEAAERRTWTGKRGSLEFIKPRPGVGIMVFRGKLTDDCAAAWHEHFPWLVAEEGTHVFFDGGELDQAGMRMAASGISMIVRMRSRIAAAHVLVRSGYVETLADAANMSFGGYMQLHRERRVFEAELERALRPASRSFP
jgi:hypothetical protein